MGSGYANRGSHSPPFMAIAFRAVHDIAKVKSINTNPLVMVADRAAIDARNNTPASLLKAYLSATGVLGRKQVWVVITLTTGLRSSETNGC